MKLLFAEDEVSMAEAVTDILTYHNYTVDTVYDGADVHDYAKTRPVFEEYKAKRYSNQFLSGHETEIALYRAAQATFRRILAGAKLPKMDALKAEAARLTADKKALYAEYRAARTDMRELVTVKANIDRLFGLTDEQKTKEMEQQRHDANKADRPR